MSPSWVADASSSYANPSLEGFGVRVDDLERCRGHGIPELVVVVMGGVGAGTLVEDGGRVSVESRLGHVRDVGDTLDEHNNGRRGMT